MLVTFISISRISTARHPSGFEIRCKKMFNLLNRVSSSLFLKTSWKHPC